MTPLVMFRKAYDSINAPAYGLLQGQVKAPIEKIGPSGYEKYAHIIGSTDQASTFPHIDKFRTLSDIYDNNLPSNIRDHGAIVLSGTTYQYTVDVYDNNIISLNQYFLEHPTRDGIQYLIFVDEEDSNPQYRFKTFIPGLLYDSEGVVLGYLHSYVANSSGKIILELPYINSTGYSIQGVTNNYTGSENLVELTVYSNSYLSIAKGSHTIQNIKLFRNGSANGTRTFTVKNVNEYGDYTVAAQLTSNNVKDIVEFLSELNEETIILTPDNHGIENIGIRTWFPTTFISLLNRTPSEEVANITPNFYNVPAAFVPTNNNKVFMTDVFGVSANKILNGAIS